MSFNRPTHSLPVLELLALAALGPATVPARAWDSAGGNPTHSTHSYLTEWAIGQLQKEAPELRQFRRALVDGANQELHGRPVTRRRHGVILDGRRRNHPEGKEGFGDAESWWSDSLKAYRNGDKEQAYFLLGILLHTIEDMGVPAHANGVVHKGNLSQCDNLEFMALWNWSPSFQAINRSDPGYAAPWLYCTFSKEWTRADALDYRNRTQFPKTWAFASAGERALLRNRQGRTCHVTMWALKSAVKAFGPETTVRGKSRRRDLDGSASAIGTGKTRQARWPQPRTPSARGLQTRTRDCKSPFAPLWCRLPAS